MSTIKRTRTRTRRPIVREGKAVTNIAASVQIPSYVFDIDNYPSLKAKYPDIDLVISSEHIKAIESIIYTNKVAIKGSAGTGKTFIIELFNSPEFKEFLSLHKDIKVKNTYYTAVTGTAVLNLKDKLGMAISDKSIGTVSSLLSLGAYDTTVSINPKKVDISLRNCIIFVDEALMWSESDFNYFEEAIKEVCSYQKIHSNNYPKIVLMGDFCQLPPVDTESGVLSSDILKSKGYSVVSLTKVKRQKDVELEEDLKVIRQLVKEFPDKTLSELMGTNKTLASIVVKLLNLRDKDGLSNHVLEESCVITGYRNISDYLNGVLSGKHKRSLDINLRELNFNIAKLYLLNSNNEQVQYCPKTLSDSMAISEIRKPYESLEVFKGMKIIVSRNGLDENGTQYYNGQLGTVVDILLDSENKLSTVVVKLLDSEDILYISKYTEDKSIIYRGKLHTLYIEYFPINLSYAMSVRKVQGRTLSKGTIYIDCFLRRKISFFYTLLSRFISYDGIKII